MMVSRFLDSSRLQRARRISNNKVPVFNKLSSDPLIVYCEIQGSGSTPYKVMIDMKGKQVYHDCPDIRRSSGGWCKHLGKLLLMLDTREVQQVYEQYKHSKRVIYQTSQLPTLVKEYQVELMDSNDFLVDEDLSLIDLLQLSERFVDTSIPPTLGDRIDELLHEEIRDIPSMQIPVHLAQLMDNMNAKVVVLLNQTLNDILNKSIKSGLSVLFNQFPTLSLKIRLEVVFDIQNLAKKSGFDFKNYEFPDLDDYDPHEKSEFVAILELLIPNAELRQQILDKLDLNVDPSILDQTTRRIALTLRIKGTSHSRLKIWAESKLSWKERKLNLQGNIDDILIYVLKTMGNTQRWKPNFNNKLGISNLLVRILEDPILMFCLQRLIEDNRDYVTREEHKRHSKFFSYLAGQEVETNWVEHLRTFEPNGSLPSSGLLVQFDITGNIHHRELLHAYTDEFRVVIDPNSPVANKIQPFDITICHSNMTTINRNLKMVYPVAILSIDQVLMYIKQGNEIISNVLPWSILSDYYRGKQINASKIQPGIVRTQNYEFVYGALQLLKELERLQLVGPKGATPEMYKEIYDFIQADSGRLNKRSRPVIKKLMNVEKEDLDTIFDLIGLSRNERMKLVLNALKKSDTLIQFRKNLVEDISNKLLKNGLDNQLIDQIDNLDLGNYQYLFTALSNKTAAKVRSIRHQLENNRLTRKKLRSNSVGEVIAEELNIGHAGSLVEEEKEAINYLLEKIDRSI